MADVCMSVRLSVCQPLHITTNGFCENFTTDVSVDEEELIKFWKSSTSKSGSSNFLKDLKHCEIGHFSTFLVISLEKTDRILMKISSQLYPQTRKCSLNFQSNPDSDMNSGSRPDLPWSPPRYAPFECSCFCYASVLY